MRYTRYTGWLLPGVLLLLAGGCGGDGDGTGPGEAKVARVAITPRADTLRALQDTARLAAEVTDTRGERVAGAAVTWQSLEPAVATVDSLGRVVSRGVGTARITATSGGVSDTAVVTVLSGAATGQLVFMRLSSTAPPLVTRDTSFWVVKHDGREVEIRFRAQPGQEGERFLRFKVPGDALLAYPDGRSFARTDSVRIRIRVDESARFVFQFEPSGLRFDPNRPAELEVRYAEAQAEDIGAEDRFSVWKQEQTDQPWIQLATARVRELSEMRAQVTGFTGFAVATNRS